MTENQLPKNITAYRKKKALSQEKLAELMGVSRQAVTKWESGNSKPSSENLIKLAELLEINVETLLGNNKEENGSNEETGYIKEKNGSNEESDYIKEETDNKKEEIKQEEISIGKAPWLFIGISVLIILVYTIYSAAQNIFSLGTLILMFVLCIPIQLFLHVYFSYAIKNSSFTGIAGFDSKTEYNVNEVKKMLVQIDLHIGIMTTVYVFLFCVLNCVGLEIEWLNNVLILIYCLDFIGAVGIINYKTADRIYRKEEDRKRAKSSIPATVISLVLFFAEAAVTFAVFEVRGIENNTPPALKIAGLMILGVICTTIGLLVESSNIKKWDIGNEKYKMSKVSVVCFLISVIVLAAMWWCEI